MSKTTDKLCELLSGATEQDLADVEAQIASAESTARAAYDAALAKLAGLKKVRDLLARQLGKVKPHPLKGKKRQKASAPSLNGHTDSPLFDNRRLTLCRHIAAKGPMPAYKLRELVQVGTPTLMELLNSDLFERSNDGYHLTTKGHQAAKGE